MRKLSDLITAAIFIVLMLGAGIGLITATERVGTWHGQTVDTASTVESQRAALIPAGDAFDGREDETLSTDGAIQVAIAD